MRWFAVTLGLIAAGVVLVAGIYLRDRQPGAWHPPPALAARADAAVILDALNGGHCGDCAVTRVQRDASGLWLAQLRIHDQVRCARIDPDRFAITARSGLVGMQLIVCK